jgi:hypothetical protein
VASAATWGAGPSFDWAFYRGTIGTGRTVILQAGVADGTITGGYFYESKGVPIDLEGTVDELGAVSIRETVDNKETGRFEGSFKDEQRRMVGQWASADGTKTLAFTLMRFATQRADVKTEHVQEQTVESSRAFPLFEDPKEAGLNTAVISHLDALYKTFLNEIKKAADPAFKADSTFDVDVDVAAYRPGAFVSLVFTTSLYAGGAHGMTQFDTLNLRLGGAGGPKAVGLSDLFSSEEDAIKALSHYSIADLKKQEAGFVLDGMVSSLDKKLLSHFTLSPRGTTFLFEPYAVAPYADGTFEVTVPFTAVETLLKTGALEGIAALPHP